MMSVLQLVIGLNMSQVPVHCSPPHVGMVKFLFYLIYVSFLGHVTCLQFCFGITYCTSPEPVFVNVAVEGGWGPAARQVPGSHRLF